MAVHENKTPPAGIKGKEVAEQKDMKMKTGVTLAACTRANPGVRGKPKDLKTKKDVTLPDCMVENPGVYDEPKNPKYMWANHCICDELKDPKTATNPGIYDKLRDPNCTMGNHDVYDELKDQKTKNGVTLTDFTVANPGVYNKMENLVLK